MVLDEASGYTAAVDEITYKMLAYLTTPLPADCPSAIRYDMAKYDSELVDKTYQDILAQHKAGKLYTNVPFDPDRPMTHCMMTSVSPLSTLEGVTCPVVLCDTHNTEHAKEICAAAKEKGLHLTVLMTEEGDFPCDRLLVEENLYSRYKTAAPTVGVRFSYDVKAPKILDRVTALADEGITLIDAYPTNPDDRAAGEQTTLIKELGKVAKELFLRIKEGRAVEFLPFAWQCRNAKHAEAVFCHERCLTCSHRMHCGGRALSYADCEIKRACADAQILLELTAEK